MATSTSSETQLLAEHFGYPPVSLLDDIINSINILAEQALNSVEKGLLSVPPASLGFRAQQHQPPPPPPPATKSKHGRQPAPPPAPPLPPSASPEEQQRHEVENGTHQLETLLCASIDRNFDIFELWVMRNILTVRPEDRDWIRLSHYEGLDFSAVASRRRKGSGGEHQAENIKNGDVSGVGRGGGGGGEDLTSSGGEGQVDGAGAGEGAEDDHAAAPTVASVARLRRRLQASQKLNVMLHAERARNAALLDELRTFLHGRGGNETGGATAVKSEAAPEAAAGAAAAPSLAFLRDKGDLTVSDAETPLTTTAAFTLSQLQALRALSTSLRTMMPDLDQQQRVGGDGGSTARRTWRTERLEYVEGAARKHLEKVRGLELGPGGEVRDGEWQGQGRSFAPGEVEGLEKVVALIGDDGVTSKGQKRPRDVDDAMDES